MVHSVEEKLHPLLLQVEEPLRTQVLGQGRRLTIARGETVQDRQCTHHCLGVVLRGRIQVYKNALLMSTLWSGDLFGAATLFSQREEEPTTLTALTTCELLLIPQEGVRRLLRESGSFAEGYVTYLSDRIRFLSDRLSTLSAGTAEGKLAQYLLAVAGAEGEVHLSATRLAALIGVGRATLYRAFDSLEGEGLIARTGKTIRIVDREGLQGKE